MLSVRCFGRNCPKVFSNTTTFHPAYSRIFGNQKMRSSFQLLYMGRKSLPRRVKKYEFISAQNRMYQKARVMNEKALLRMLSKPVYFK